MGGEVVVAAGDSGAMADPPGEWLSHPAMATTTGTVDTVNAYRIKRTGPPSDPVVRGTPQVDVGIAVSSR
ncbi:MAG: hypothetical protein ACRDRA_20620 [Pseudonocardiaceae bacterium]